MESPREAIVVLNGCFNPVHMGHVAVLEEAKRIVEAKFHKRVVAGYFAVAGDDYLRGKLQLRTLPKWMKQNARVEMCKSVMEDVGWNVSAAVFPGANQCGKAMVTAHHSRDTEIFSVRKLINCEKVRAGTEGTNVGLSSTMIRKHLQDRAHCPSAVPELVRASMMLPAVALRLQQLLSEVKSAGKDRSEPDSGAFASCENELVRSQAMPSSGRDAAVSVLDQEALNQGNDANAEHIQK